MADKLVNELTAATTPLLDTDIALVSRDGVRLDRVALSDMYSFFRQDIVKTTTATVTNNSNTTLVPVTALEFPVLANKTYFFDFIIRYQAAATTTGLVMTLVTPAGTLTASLGALQAADGTAARFDGAITTSGDLVTSTATAAANTDTVAYLTGVFVSTASGTISPQFRSSVNGSLVTITIGSVGKLASN